MPPRNGRDCLPHSVLSLTGSTAWRYQCPRVSTRRRTLPTTTREPIQHRPFPHPAHGLNPGHRLPSSLHQASQVRRLRPHLPPGSSSRKPGDTELNGNAKNCFDRLSTITVPSPLSGSTDTSRTATPVPIPAPTPKMVSTNGKSRYRM